MQRTVVARLVIKTTVDKTARPCFVAGKKPRLEIPMTVRMPDIRYHFF
jgi:hypothetical protein